MQRQCRATAVKSSPTLLGGRRKVVSDPAFRATDRLWVLKREEVSVIGRADIADFGPLTPAPDFRERR